MSDSMEYEDFLPNVRKSLYGKAHLASTKPNENTNRKPKKVKFIADRIPHNGHNISESEFHTLKSEKLKNRKSTPLRKKNKKEPLLHETDIYSHQPEKLKEERLQHVKKKIPKKRQLVISFSSSSDSFDEELKDIVLTPSKSELETFQCTISKSKRKPCDINESASGDKENESSDDFDLETYFNTREISDLNESVIETHSGINYEFVSDRARDVKIIESESIYSDKGINNDTDSGDERDIGSSEDMISEFDTDQNVDSIVDEIQETMTISDDNSKGTSSVSLQENSESQEVTLPNNYGIAEYYDLGHEKLVVLKKKQSLSFHGLFTLKVLYGKIEVFGHILTSSSKAVNLYSPRGSALLYIRNITDNHTSTESVNISDLFRTQNDLETINDLYIEPNDAAVLCSKLVDSKLLFLEKYVSQKIFPRLESNNIPQVVFEPSGNLNTTKNSTVWDDILSSVNSTTKLMITGGKGVGKSTLLRYAINKLLNTFDKVRILDLDPGQSEFAVPGCISVVTVMEPTFGPNFTHLKQTNRSLLSNINVAHDPRAYVKCIKSIVSYMETLEGEYPILINHMGFVQGIGLNLVASAIQYIQPTGIIQICSKNIKKNFKDDLKYKIVKEHCKLFSVDNEHLDYLELNYKLYKVPAMNDGNDGWTLGPRESREMNVLTYFGQMMQNGVNSLTSHELPMYEVKLSSMKLTNLQGDDIVPAVVNANMVVLCSLEPELNVFVCKGYGVIRGIDLECDKLILLTPEPATVLEEVHYLVMGSVFLPPAIYMTPDDVTGTIPYVMEGELVSFGQITKRSYLPANKK